MGGKLSRLVYLTPTQVLVLAVSSFNSYCIIILEYIVVRDENIILVKLTFTSNIQFGYACPRGWGASCPGWFILPPAQDLGQTVSSVNSYCTITLEYLVVRDVNIISVKLRCLHLTFSPVILVRGVGGKLSRLVYLGPRPGFGSNSVISQFLLHHYLGIFSCKRCEHYFGQTGMLASNVQFGYPCPRGGGTSCPGWFILPPPQDLGQAVSSVNCYCTIILEYLVVRDINIILVKLRCLHPMFSLVTFVQGVGGKLSRMVYLTPPPTQGLGQAVSSFNSYCTITLEYLVVRDVNIISVKTTCLHPTVSLVTLVRGVGGKLSRLVYLAPPAQDLGQTVSSVNSYCTIILEYLVVRDVNIISVKLRCLHLTFSSVIHVRGVEGKLSRFVYLAPCPGFGSNSVISQF